MVLSLARYCPAYRPKKLWFDQGWRFTLNCDRLSCEGCSMLGETLTAMFRGMSWLSSWMTDGGRARLNVWFTRSYAPKNHALSRTIGPPNDPPTCARRNGCSPGPPFSGFEK